MAICLTLSDAGLPTAQEDNNPGPSLSYLPSICSHPSCHFQTNPTFLEASREIALKYKEPPLTYHNASVASGAEPVFSSGVTSTSQLCSLVGI